MIELDEVTFNGFKAIFLILLCYKIWLVRCDRTQTSLSPTNVVIVLKPQPNGTSSSLQYQNIIFIYDKC